MNSAATLTPRQREFVSHYLVLRNGAEAARRAGFSANGAKVTACRLLTNPNLRAALAAKEAELAREMGLTRERVIGELMAAVEAARSQANPGAVIRGFVEIAKMAGLYAPEQIKVVLGAEDERVRMKLSAMSDLELIEIAEGRVA